MTQSHGKNAALLPCPFCGKPGAICCFEDEPGSPAGFWVNCSCGIETVERRTEVEAVAHWNTRSMEKRLAAEIEQLQAKLHCVCGLPIDHSAMEGHSPVSMYDYAKQCDQNALRERFARELWRSRGGIDRIWEDLKHRTDMSADTATAVRLCWNGADLIICLLQDGVNANG